MKKPALQNKAVRSFTNGFSGSKSFRDFRETGPWSLETRPLSLETSHGLQESLKQQA